MSEDSSSFAGGLANLMRSMGGSTKAAIAAATAPLEARIRDLEQRRGLKYLGVWDQNASYGLTMS